MKLDAWSQSAYEQMNVRWREHGLFLGRRNSRAVLRLARRCLKGRILDAGCGDGTMVRALRARLPRAEVTGVDVAPVCADEGIVASNLAKMPFADASFDCVLLMDVLEHLPVAETSGIVRELCRVLAPSGRLCVTVPNNENIDASLVICPHCRELFHPSGHTQVFTPASLRSLLTDCGFADVRVKTYGLDAYYHLGIFSGLVSAAGRILLPKMRWDEWLFADARPNR